MEYPHTATLALARLTEGSYGLDLGMAQEEDGLYEVPEVDPIEINWEGREAELLARLASSDPQLTELYVPSFVAARELAAALALNTTLTSADLEYNNIGDDGACELALGLGRNAALKTLNLYHNNIGPAGAGALSAALAMNSSLTALNLEYDKVGADGCRPPCGSPGE